MAIIYTARAERVEDGALKTCIYVGQTSRTLREERKKEHLIAAYVTNHPDFFHQTMARYLLTIGLLLQSLNVIILDK